MPGEYDVEIFDPDGKPIYQGKLHIEMAGVTYHLRWCGAGGNYQGLGLMAAQNVLAANY